MEQDTKEEEAQTDTGKPDINYWISQLDAYDNATAQKRWRKDTSRAWEEYLNDKVSADDDPLKPAAARHPIFWASIRTMKPAIYSRTPITISEKAFAELNDDVSRVASMGYERLAKYLIRRSPFDRTFYSVCDDYLMGGKCAPRVYWEADISEQKSKTYYKPAPGPDGQPAFVDEQGQPFQGQELQQDEQGYYAETVTEDLKGLKCELINAHYKDYRHTPNARNQEEIDWWSYDSLMTKAEFKKRFGDELAELVNFVPIGDAKKDRAPDDMKGVPTLYVTVTEIWNKRTKEVYWLDKCYAADWLDIKPDPYELEGFFPVVPYMLGTCGPDDMFPMPDYIQLEPLIKQMHGMADRLKTLIRAAQRRGICTPELADWLNSTTADGEFFALANLQDLLGDGDLDKLVKYFPTEELVKAARELFSAFQEYEQKFNDVYGIPDILRGVSDPNETAAAQQLKGKFLSLRFSAIQREFQRVVRDGIEMMCDLMLGKCPESKLAQIMGYQFMKPEDQQVFPQSLALLKNDEERLIRIEIETDSTITMNMNAEIEQYNYLAKTIFEGITAIAQASQDDPRWTPVAMETLMLVVSKLQQGKQIEGVLRPALEAAMQPQEGEPDHEGAKIQQEAQLKTQELQLKAQEIQQTGQLKQADLELQNKKIDLDTQLAQMKQQLDGLKLQMDQQNMQHKLQIEQYKVVLSEKEKWLTELRLQREEKDKSAEQSGGMSPHAPRKRKFKITHNDEDGSAEIEALDQPREYAP